jgi:hypothetical protein
VPAAGDVEHRLGHEEPLLSAGTDATTAVMCAQYLEGTAFILVLCNSCDIMFV